MDRVLCLLIYVITAFARFSRWLAKIGIGSYEEYRSGKKLKILLVGYNGARNTGSDVRVAAIAQQVGELFDDDVELLPFSSFFPFHLYRACCSHHAAILCEGSTLKSTFANGLTLFLCEAAGIMNYHSNTEEGRHNET